MSGEFHDEVFDPDEAELEEKLELSHLIDEWLAAARPERYDVGDKQWQDPVVEKVEAELADMPREQMIREAARRRVYGREQQASRRANDFLRAIFNAGQLPLWWGGEDEEWKLFLFGAGRMPICIGKLRVRLGAVTTADLEEWILARRDQQDKELASREQAVNGAVMLVQWMRDQDARRLEDLRRNAD
jgi:hypothetical protein